MKSSLSIELGFYASGDCDDLHPWLRKPCCPFACHIFSQFEQQSIIWYSFLCQVMCSVTYKHMYVWKAQQQT